MRVESAEEHFRGEITQIGSMAPLADDAAARRQPCSFEAPQVPTPNKVLAHSAGRHFRMVSGSAAPGDIAVRSRYVPLSQGRSGALVVSLEASISHQTQGTRR